MLQALMTHPGTIEYHTVPTPIPQDGQLLLKIMRIGICGSDIHVNLGKHPFTQYPVVQGHEVSAQVVQLGPQTTGFLVGDRVTVQPQVVCGECYPCTHNMYNDCEVLKVMGFQTTGMASEYFVVDANKCLPLPQEMSWDYGAMIEPLAVAVHAIKRVPSMVDKSVLVVGGGPIGNLVAQTAKAAGAKTVVLSEVSEFRLQIAQECGIQAINPAKQDWNSAILTAFGSDKADYIFECVGAASLVNQCIETARKGSTIVVVGVVADSGSIQMGIVQDHELTILGSAMYREDDFIDAIDFVKQGKIHFYPLLTHTFSFDQFEQAYALIAKQKDKAMKVMISLE